MIIGLTGGIASGKSTVSNYLKALGIPIVDADRISRQVVEPGGLGLSKIVDAFGDTILEEGFLNRRKLREIIFSDDDKRLLLNSILHPIIHDEIVNQLELLKHEPIVVFDAPLLLENNLKYMVDILWVVAADEDVQIKRVIARDQIDFKEAKAIVDKQMSLSEKIGLADVVIENNSTIEVLKVKVDQALEKIKITER